MRRLLASPLVWGAAALLGLSLVAVWLVFRSSAPVPAAQPLPVPSDTRFTGIDGTTTQLDTDVSATSGTTDENGVMDPVQPGAEDSAPGLDEPLRAPMLSSSGDEAKAMLDYCANTYDLTVLRLTVFAAQNGTAYTSTVSFYSDGAYSTDTTDAVRFTSPQAVPGDALTWYVIPHYHMLGGAVMVGRSLPKPLKAGTTRARPPSGKAIAALAVCVTPK